MEKESPKPEEKGNIKPINSYFAGLRFLRTIATCINGIFSYSFIGYFFWQGFLYLIGSFGILAGWIQLAPRVRDEIICPNTTIYLNAGLWALQGITMLITCYSYSSIVGDNFENNLYNPTTSINVLGFLVKTGPVIVRFFHLFTFCLIFTNTFNALFLQECNSIYVRRVIAFSIVIWWTITVFGIIFRKGIALPPYLYNPHNGKPSLCLLYIFFLDIEGGTLFIIQTSLKYFGV